MSERITLMGCSIDNLSMEETLQTIEGFIHTGKPHQHVVVNVDKLVKASRDPELRQIINDCALINVDGMPVVWASRLLGKPLKERVAGVDLFEALMRRAGEKGWRVFLLGAREEVVSKVAETYTRKYPALRLAGYRNGYWKGEEEEAAVADVGLDELESLSRDASHPLLHGTVGVGQVVDHHHLMAGVLQLDHGVRTDITHATSNQNLHCMSLS